MELKQKVNYQFTLRNKSVLKGELIKEYPYKNGITYLYILGENGKKYLINPKNATKL